jgi:L-fuculose-phosphate aldolase
MVEQGLTYASMGNVSRRIGADIVISKLGALLDETYGDFITAELEGEPHPDASSDFPVHREIYRKTDAKIVLHGHSPYAVALSLIEKDDSIKPVDFESEKLLTAIPIVKPKKNLDALAVEIAETLTFCKGCIVRGHGTYAIGATIMEAFTNVSVIEHACRVKYLVDSRPKSKGGKKKAKPKEKKT